MLEISSSSGRGGSGVDETPLASQLPLIPTAGTANGSEGQDRVFRPIHYLGSKLRMVDAIVEAVDEVDPTRGRVCDLFSGSGTVTSMFARSRTVTAVDIQEYSRVLSSAILHPTPASLNMIGKAGSGEGSSLGNAMMPMVCHEQDCIRNALRGCPDPLNDFLEQGSLTRFQNGEFAGDRQLWSVLNETVSRLAAVGLDHSDQSLITRMFGGVYFSYAQSVALDTLLDIVFSATQRERDVLLAAVLSTASEVVNTVGKHFAQPIRPRNKEGVTKANLLDKICKDRSADVPTVFTKWLERYRRVMRTERPHAAIRSDYRDALSSSQEDIRVVYADPPYTRDHYSRYYHVLETMSLRDDPLVSKVRIGGMSRVSRGIYRMDRHQSPFCIPSKASGAFSTLFSMVSRKRLPLVLSYSPYDLESDARPRLLTIDEIEELARKNFGSVLVRNVGAFSHSKLTNSRLTKASPKFSEFLIICRP